MEAIPAKGQSIEAVKQGLFDEVKTLQSQRITPSELARIKKQVIASNTFSRDSMEEEAMSLGEAEMAGIPWQEVMQFNQHIQAVTSDQVQQVVQQYFTSKQLTIAVLEPEASAQAPKTPFQAGGLS